MLTDTARHLGDTGPGGFIDLTAWECSVNSFHLEDFVPVTVDVLDDGEPVIAEADQRLLLAQGLTLALHICHLGRSVEPPLQIRCVVTRVPPTGPSASTASAQASKSTIRTWTGTRWRR